MRPRAVPVCCISVILFLSCGLHAQARKTIILVRHAEKDSVQSEMSGDPELSPVGRQRAERLVQAIKKYKPGAVYSTDTRRTRSTAEPMARQRHLVIQIYDPQKQDDLVRQIMANKTKRFLIVGHSDTIPALANLLVKKRLFHSLDDNEYGAIWLIKIKNSQVRNVEVLSY